METIPEIRGNTTKRKGGCDRVQKHKWLELGDQLKKLREKHGMTQIEFGLKLHTTESTIKNYETGRTKVPDNIIKRACERFPVTPNYFFMEENDGDKGAEELLQIYLHATEAERARILAIARIEVGTKECNICTKRV